MVIFRYRILPKVTDTAMEVWHNNEGSSAQI